MSRLQPADASMIVTDDASRSAAADGTRVDPRRVCTRPCCQDDEEGRGFQAVVRAYRQAGPHGHIEVRKRGIGRAPQVFTVKRHEVTVEEPQGVRVN